VLHSFRAVVGVTPPNSTDEEHPRAKRERLGQLLDHVDEQH
jgi:hypothetical protein